MMNTISRNSLTRKNLWHELFFTHLEESGKILQACKKVNVTSRSIYNRMKSDHKFKERVQICRNKMRLRRDEEFFKILEEVGIISHACERVKMSYSNVLYRMKRDHNFNERLRTCKRIGELRICVIGKKWNNHERLFEYLKTYGNLKKACTKAGVTTTTIYRIMKSDHHFSKRILECKASYIMNVFGCTVTDFYTRKPGYMCRCINKESERIYNNDIGRFKRIVFGSASKAIGAKFYQNKDEILNETLIMFLYSRFNEIKNPDALIKFYARCSAFKILQR